MVWIESVLLPWASVQHCFPLTLVPGLLCKEFGSHHSILTSKSLNKLKNQHLFLYLSENWSHRANHCPPNWRGRQVDKESHSYWSVSPWAETSMGISVRVGKSELWWIPGGSGWTSLKIKNSSLRKTSHFCKLCFQEPDQVLSVKIGEKSHSASEAGGEAIIWNTHPFLLNKSCVEGDYFTGAWHTGWDAK